MNPWVRSAASLAKTHVKHYYKQRVREKEFWVKLASGQVAWNSLAGLIGNVKAALSPQAKNPPTTFQIQMAISWKAFHGNILLLLSGNDYTAREFSEYSKGSDAWAGAFEKNGLFQHLVPDADHTFSELRFNSIVAQHTLDFLGKSEAR